MTMLDRKTILRARAPLSVEADEGAPHLGPGRIEWDKRGVLVGTATSPVVVETLQPPGKKMMSALDWVRGARLEDGAAFV